MASVIEELEVAEAATWHSEMHPRWPKGGPHGGEFIRIGEHFLSQGLEWEVAHVVKGKVIAHRVSSAKGQKSYEKDTKTFDVKGKGLNAHVPGIEFKVAAVPEGSHEGAGNVTVVNPYVDPTTHDNSIPIPPGSPITPEEWQRFGELDQLVYTELQERFGEYHDKHQTEQLVEHAYSEASAAADSMVRAAFHKQYGESSGYTLSLADDQVNESAGSPSSETRLEALNLIGELGAAVQWDLYNRTHSPDVSLMHRDDNNHDRSWWQQKKDEGLPIFSTLSQSFQPVWSGSTGLITPMAIRHIALSTHSALASSNASSYYDEKEVAVPFRWIPDERSYAFDKNDPGDNKALEWYYGATNSPAGGEIVEAVIDHVKNGTYLAPVAAKPDIQGVEGEKTWLDPPTTIANPFPNVELPTADTSTKIAPENMPKGVPYAKLDENGNPVAQTGQEAGAHVGQYFFGLGGTLYWIGPDTGKETDYPFHIFKLENGTVTNENFDYNASLPGYYLDKSSDFNIDAWVKANTEGGVPDFEPSQWTMGLDEKFVEQFQTGEKFAYNGAYYEVLGPTGDNKVKLLNLKTGKKAQINGNTKMISLIPLSEAKDAKPLEPPKTYAPGDWVQTEFGKAHVITVAEGEEGQPQTVKVGYTAPSLKDSYWTSDKLVPWAPNGPAVPPVGTMFVYEDGKPAVVTHLNKDGTIQVNKKPGKEKITQEEWEAKYRPHAFLATGWEIADHKTKLKDMSPGDIFHVGQGNQTMHPYQVVGPTYPKNVAVQNMQTGEVSEMSRNVSHRMLVPQAANNKPGESKATPTEVTAAGGIAPPWDPAKFELSGESMKMADVPVGSYFKGGNGAVLLKTSQEGTVSTYDNVTSGAKDLHFDSGLSSLTYAQFQTYKPKGAASATGATLEVEGEAEPSPLLWSKGDHVATPDDRGPGVIQEVDNGKAAIVFDSDGSTTWLPVDQLAHIAASPGSAPSYPTSPGAYTNLDFPNVSLGEAQPGALFKSEEGNIFVVQGGKGGFEGNEVPVEAVATPPGSKHVPGYTTFWAPGNKPQWVKQTEPGGGPSLPTQADLYTPVTGTGEAKLESVPVGTLIKGNSGTIYKKIGDPYGSDLETVAIPDGASAGVGDTHHFAPENIVGPDAELVPVKAPGIPTPGEDIQVGDHVRSSGGFSAVVQEINPQTGEVKVVFDDGSDGWKPLNTIVKEQPAYTPPTPASLNPQATASWEKTSDVKTLAEVPVGTVFGVSWLKDGLNLYEKTSSQIDAEGNIPVKGVATPQGDASMADATKLNAYEGVELWQRKPGVSMAGTPAPAPDPGDPLTWEHGAREYIAEMPDGTYFVGNTDQHSGGWEASWGGVIEKVGGTEGAIKLRSPITGKETLWTGEKGAANFATILIPPADAPAPGEHDAATPFDPSAYKPGEKTTIGQLAPGTVFRTKSNKGWNYYRVSDNGEQMVNLLTGKVMPNKPKWKATTLVAVEGKHQPAGAKPGELMKLGDAPVGTHFNLEDGSGHNAIAEKVANEGDGARMRVISGQFGQYTAGGEWPAGNVELKVVGPEVQQPLHSIGSEQVGAWVRMVPGEDPQRVFEVAGSNVGNEVPLRPLDGQGEKKMLWKAAPVVHVPKTNEFEPTDVTSTAAAAAVGDYLYAPQPNNVWQKIADNPNGTSIKAKLVASGDPKGLGSEQDIGAGSVTFPVVVPKPEAGLGASPLPTNPDAYTPIGPNQTIKGAAPGTLVKTDAGTVYQVIGGPDEEAMMKVKLVATYTGAEADIGKVFPMAQLAKNQPVVVSSATPSDVGSKPYEAYTKPVMLSQVPIGVRYTGGAPGIQKKEAEIDVHGASTTFPDALVQVLPDATLLPQWSGSTNDYTASVGKRLPSETPYGTFFHSPGGEITQKIGNSNDPPGSVMKVIAPGTTGDEINSVWTVKDGDELQDPLTVLTPKDGAASVPGVGSAGTTNIEDVTDGATFSADGGTWKKLPETGMGELLTTPDGKGVNGVEIGHKYHFAWGTPVVVGEVPTEPKPAPVASPALPDLTEFTKQLTYGQLPMGHLFTIGPGASAEAQYMSIWRKRADGDENAKTHEMTPAMDDDTPAYVATLPTSTPGPPKPEFPVRTTYGQLPVGAKFVHGEAGEQWTKGESGDTDISGNPAPADSPDETVYAEAGVSLTGPSSSAAPAGTIGATLNIPEMPVGAYFDTGEGVIMQKVRAHPDGTSDIKMVKGNGQSSLQDGQINSGYPKDDGHMPTFKIVAAPEGEGQPPVTEGMLGDLEQGDRFTVPPGWAQAGTTFEVVSDEHFYHAPVPGINEGAPWWTIMAKPVNSSGGMESFRVDLDLGKPGPEAAHDSTPVEVLDPKTSNVATADLSQGDITMAINLQLGDLFTSSSEPGTFKVTLVPDPGAASYEDQLGTAMKVLPGGELGNAITLTPEATVVFKAKAGDTLPKAIPPVLYDNLPDAEMHGKLKGFNVDAAGPFVFTQIGMLPSGSQFVDAHSRQWAVKNPGAQAVVSDGDFNYKVVDPSIKVADTSQRVYSALPALHDHAPPLPGIGDENTNAAKAEMVANEGEVGLGGLKLHPGDFVEIGGEVLEIEPPDNNWIKVRNVTTGKISYRGKTTVPEMISPQHTIGNTGGATPEPPMPATLRDATDSASYTETADYNLLPKGTKYVMQPGGMISEKASGVEAGEPGGVIVKVMPGQKPDIEGPALDPNVENYTQPANYADLPQGTAYVGSMGVPVFKAGASTSFGEVKVIPGSVPPKSDLPTSPVGFTETAKYNDLPVGTFYKKADGGYQNPLEKTMGTQAGDADFTVLVQPGAVLPKPEGSSPDFSAPATNLPAVKPPSELMTNVAVPFQQQASGAFKQLKLGVMQPGQQFTDKSSGGERFRVIAHLDNGNTVYEDVTTHTQYTADSMYLMRPTDLPPDPGPILAPVIHDINQTYGSVHNVPEQKLTGYLTINSGGKKRPMVGRLAYGQHFYTNDSSEGMFTLLAPIGDGTALVRNEAGDPRLVDARTRVLIGG